jgi:hypothetical protein
MINAEARVWLDEMAAFLCADAWSEDRVRELLINIWLDGYNTKGKEVIDADI